ncbi:hypothetical protein [Pseudomonas fluorescens]|nr:hypothetical protein [Pseudomonas fluorescens]
MNVNWEGLLPIQGEIIVIEDDPTLRWLMSKRPAKSPTELQH